jgi:glycogen operon protein
MTQRDWQQPSAHVLGVFLNGQEIADRTPRGEPIEDDSFLLLFNAHHEDMAFTLPGEELGAVWHHVLDTAEESCRDDLPFPSDDGWSPSSVVNVTSRSLQVLRQPRVS